MPDRDDKPIDLGIFARSEERAFSITEGVAALLSFAISNGSFYLLSGLFGALSLAGFAEQFARYAPGFVLTGSAWIVLGLAVVWLLQREARGVAARA